MPATAARIAFITEQYRLATAGPDSNVVAKYGSLARDTEEPIPTFFDDILDVAAAVDARILLLSADRRRMQFSVRGEDTGLALAYGSTTPAVTMIDAQRSLNKPGAVVEFSIDFDKGVSTLVTWG